MIQKQKELHIGSSLKMLWFLSVAKNALCNQTRIDLERLDCPTILVDRSCLMGTPHPA